MSLFVYIIQAVQDSTKNQNNISFDFWSFISHPVVSSVLAAIIFSILTYLFYTRRINRTYVKIIKKSKDKDVYDFIDLYEKTIDEHLRINSEEILNWLDKNNDPLIKNYKVKHYLFLCKIGRRVVGFLKVMYCLSTNNLFIAYIGIDKNAVQARKIASEVMLKKLLKFIRTKFSDCKAIFIELEKPTSTDNAKQISEKKARIKLFSLFAKQNSITPYIIDISYLQPEMPTDIEEHHKEEELYLMYFPLTKIKSTHIAKDDVLQILRFIYNNIYGPTYRKNIEQDVAYKKYLETLLKLYEENMPDKINLIKEF